MTIELNGAAVSATGAASDLSQRDNPGTEGGDP
jgi:hypothetical protein